MSSELLIHLVINIVITFVILYYIKKHIRETEAFYNESRIEWERRQANDKLLEQKLNNYLSEVAFENKRKLFYVEKKDESMKMYLDDLRTPIDEYDFVVRSYIEAIEIIRINGMPNFISFDHDLGEDENGNLLKTGYDLAKWIVESDLDNTYKLPSNFKYKVHSQNPVGKKNIIALLDGYLKFKNTLSKQTKNTSKCSDDSKSLLSHYLANISNTYN